MGRCTDRRDMTKAVESGVKLQTKILGEPLRLFNIECRHEVLSFSLRGSKERRFKV